MRHGLFLPPFGELADPRLLADLAAEAEVSGWDGFFLWDHVQYHDGEPVADPWVALAAIAAATSTLRIGPLVTPLSRRRPQVLARQTATLDQLSDGRLVLGVGLGGDGRRELSAFGEETDGRRRAALLDEGLELLQALWTGEEVHHAGPGYRADGVRFLPRPVQRPRIPIWVGLKWPNRAPLRRAARFDGVFPIELEPADLPALLDEVRALRPTDEPFDVVVRGEPGTDPTPWADTGATWWLEAFPSGATAADARSSARSGPPRAAG